MVAVAVVASGASTARLSCSPPSSNPLRQGVPGKPQNPEDGQLVGRRSTLYGDEGAIVVDVEVVVVCI